MLNATIEPRVHTYSDHALVMVKWGILGHGRRRHPWRLDNYLLLNQDVRTYIQKEIALFFSVNSMTDNKVILWDTFKAYSGAFINQKAYVNKKRCEVTEKLMWESGNFGSETNLTKTKELKQELDAEINELKLLETTAIAKEVMYTRKQFF